MTAFNNFNTYIAVSKTIKENGGKFVLDDPQLKQIYNTTNVVSGYWPRRRCCLTTFLMEMYSAGTDKSLVYEAIFNLKSNQMNKVL